MTTTAQRLSELLTPVSRSPSAQQFLNAVAEKIGIDGDDVEVRALQIVNRSAKKLREDIDAQDDALFSSRAEQLFSPFSPLLTFGAYHLNIQQAKQSFLKADNLTGLTDLHLMLRGISMKNDLPLKEAKQIAAEFHKLKQTVIESDGIPDGFKSVLVIRLNQTASAFDNYFAFGEEALERELEALVGAIIIQTPNASAKDIPTLKEVWDQAGKGFGLLKSVNDKAGTLISSYEKTTQLLEILAK